LHVSVHRCSFVSSVSGGHLYLHSFPTRRSSDLTFSSSVRRASTVAAAATAPARTNLPAPMTFPCRRCVCCPCVREGRASVLLGVDRKSTRLNSSHVKISYAVFCLKKKKISSKSQ